MSLHTNSKSKQNGGGGNWVGTIINVEFIKIKITEDSVTGKAI